MNPVKRDPVTGLFVRADSEPVRTETAEPMPEASQPAKRAPRPADSMEKRLVELVTPTIESAIDGKATELEARIRAELDKLPKRLEIVTNGTVRQVSGAHHPALEPCLKRIAAGIPLFLHGPTGSGKTFLAGQIGEALGRKVIVQQIISGMAEHHLLGLYAPDGEGFWRWLPSGLAEAMIDGHIYVADELPNGDCNTVTILHTVLAERKLYVPYNQNGARMIDAHPDFVLIATGNIIGPASHKYVAGNQLDAATMNRFRQGLVKVDYDRDMEKAIVGNAQVLEWGWDVREIIERHALQHDLSTRNMIDGAKLIAQGLTLDDVKESYFADWAPDARRYAESAGAL